MTSKPLKSIIWLLAAGSVLTVMFTFGLSTNSVFTFIAGLLIASVFARKFLIKKTWFQMVTIILAAMYGIGSICILIVQAYADAHIQAFSSVLFHVFLVRTSVAYMNKGYQIIVRISLFLTIFLLGYLLIFPFDSVDYLYPNKAFPALTLISTIILMFYAFVVDEHKQKETIENLEQQDSTIHWFSTLVNLVSHNLRSPLANILSNAQLLEAKYPSVKDGEEIHRITSSVNTSNQIIDRLLKGTFVTDRNSRVNLKESLTFTYPQLHIIGVPKEMAYEESVSIHLSLEVFLDNAFRFSPDKVQLTFFDTRIEIRDYGKGMSKDEIEAFGRLNKAAFGTLHGIGISFAQRILDIVDYRVKAENCDPGLLVTIHKKNNGNS